MIPGIPATQNSAATGPLTGKNVLGKDDFLRLLIAQLEAQDPLEPMDAQDFSAQLAQFSTLEQITNVNGHLLDIKALEQSLGNAAALNLIGKEVDAPGDGVHFQSGENSTLRYVLGDAAADVSIDIFDADGNLVKSLKVGAQAGGRQEAVWSGTDNFGNQVKTGEYTFKVNASNEAGESISTLTLSQGIVSDIFFENGQAFATVNGKIIPVSEIIRVSI